MNVYVDDRLYVEELNEEAVRYATHARLEAHPVGDLARWLEHPTTKIVVVGDPAALDRLEAAMRGEFGDRLFIAKSLPYFLEIARPGVSKGAALHFVCDHLGIDPADTVSFGDGANDVELLQRRGPRRGGRRRRSGPGRGRRLDRRRGSSRTGSRASWRR